MPSGLTLPVWLTRITESGVSGVQLFFVISAFTLTLHAERDQSNLSGYALRRIARVGPGYWLAAVFYTALAGTAPRLLAPDGVAVNDIVVAALFGSAWVGGAPMAVVPGGWSISVEVAFYAVLPLLYRVTGRRLWRVVLLTIAFTAIAEFRGVQAWDAHRWDFFFYVNPIQQAPVFLFGFTAATIVTRYDVPRLGLLALTALGLAVFWLPIRCSGLLYLVEPLSFGLLAAISVGLAAVSSPPLLSNPILRRIGQLSYSVYLIHFAFLAPCLGLAVRILPEANWATFIMHLGFTLAATLAVASITWRVIEQPAVEWARRHSRRRPVTVEP